MRQIAKVLDNVNNINDFEVVDEITLIRGNSATLYFQLFIEKTTPCGTSLTRYIPQGTNNTVQVKFGHLDREFQVCRVAEVPYDGDTSILSIPILANDQIAYNGMEVIVIEDGVQTKFIVESEIVFQEVGQDSLFV